MVNAPFPTACAVGYLEERPMGGGGNVGGDVAPEGVEGKAEKGEWMFFVGEYGGLWRNICIFVADYRSCKVI